VGGDIIRVGDSPHCQHTGYQRPSLPYREAQQAKGAGDAKATNIYAQAYSQDPDFYSFYRSLEAYRESFAGKSDVLVVDPSSDFFKFMKTPGKVKKN
jgi:membrane protease subunit HflC